MSTSNSNNLEKSKSKVLAVPIAADTTVIPTKIGLAMIAIYWLAMFSAIVMIRVYPTGFPLSLNEAPVHLQNR